MNRGYSSIGLWHAKDMRNISGALRAAQCFRATNVYWQPRPNETVRLRPNRVDTTKAYRHLPLTEVEDLKSVRPYKCSVIGVELCDEAIPIKNFVHPDQAFYIFGPEDGSLNNEIKDWVDTIIFIPSKFCLNLAVTVNIVLYDRLNKSSTNGEYPPNSCTD